MSAKPVEAEQSGRFPMRRSQLLDILAGMAGILTRGRSVDLDATLRLFGEPAGVDRMYLFQNSVEPGTGRTLCSQRFEWAHGSVSAEIDNPLLQNLPYDDISDDLEERFRRGEVLAGLVHHQHPKLRAILEPQGIVSICLVPVMIDGELWGYVGFDDCHAERAWSPEEISFLRLIAAILGGYFAREQMREALADAESQYRNLVDGLHEVIFETDAVGTVTFLNRAWTEHLGYSIEESLGTTMLEYVRPDMREVVAAEVGAAIGAGDDMCPHDAPFIAKSGEERWMKMLCRFTRDEQGALVSVLGTMTNITERRWAEEAMRRQQLDESLSTLAGGIAHDFNNVLHGMLGAVEILLRDHAEAPAAAELLTAIQTSGERMADMTSQLLAYARGGSYETALLDPRAVLEDALKIARLPPNVRVELSADARGHVDGDRGQLFQVVLNLVVNAVEAMERGGLLRIAIDAIELGPGDPLVRDRTLAAGAYVRLSFTDHGAGIERSAQDRIFEPFFSTKASGRGLGLAAARGVATRHGGTITVESELGRGSTFRVLLPRREGELLSHRRSAYPPPSGGMVLVVDDEEHILQVTAASLEQAGHRVLTAPGGPEALALFDAHAGDIEAVLVDYIMPGMDGGELIRELRARDPALRVILCTGYHQPDSPREELAGIPRLEKPFPIAAALALLRA